jgi:BirA family biotin operon repressor/biotin-[acetyl-CoA-carboxylase] ligase
VSATAVHTWNGVSVDTWREAWGVPCLEVHARIGSTNDRVRELAASGAEAYTVVVADEQTSGRGRRGAVWHSPAGCGLWMSVLLPTPGRDGHLGLPLLLGVAVAEAIEFGLPEVSVRIKWPNDLLIGGRKVGGILCEICEGGVVAGIGINLKRPAAGFPSGLDESVTALDVEGSNRLSASALCGEVLHRIKYMIPDPKRRAAALRCFGARDALAGRSVVAEREGPGRARGIDDLGALVLERGDGSRVRVISGSVRLDQSSS